MAISELNAGDLLFPPPTMSLSFSQTILAIEPSELRINVYNTFQQLEAVKAIQALKSDVLGVATRLSESGAVNAIAFATPKVVFHITLADTSAPQRARGTHLSPLLSGEGVTLAAFSMARLALHVQRETGHHVAGVDLSTLLAPSTRKPWSPAEFAIKQIDPNANQFRILELWYPAQDEEHESRRLCLRAWVSAVCTQGPRVKLQIARKVDTHNLTKAQLTCLGRLFRCVDILEAAKPTRADNEFSSIGKDKKFPDNLSLQNARFKSRVRRDDNTQVIMETEGGRQVIGRAVRAAGKETTIKLTHGKFQGGIKRIRVEGREQSTCAEIARDEFLLRLLQANVSLYGRLFIQLLWFPPPDFAKTNQPKHIAPTSDAFSKLNDSQREVAAAMISLTEPLVIAHGPPGTGKTTTIAAAVNYWWGQNEPVWIIAQSNVGVKNIARSFAGKGFLDFKLLVSQEFYVEWHEDLYEEIVHNLIRSDDLFTNGDKALTERLFLGCRVVLCTLSMLSNPGLDNIGLFPLIPVNRLVVDEASQICASEYMHLFHKFQKLEKVCLFGDPKQLPPFGREKTADLQSIFEIKHLKPRAYFLNTQYRMPTQLGDFISTRVYDGKLNSVHKIRDSSCVAFVDVFKGTEKQVGTSWMNQEEVNVVVSLVRDYYRHEKFCVITPYDPQRSAIQKALEKANLPSDAVYNVDSFQGHEESFVILSAVRTARPGFLTSLERMNVMLTRCKKGMIIVTNQRFVFGSAKKTLLGKLAVYWAKQSSSSGIWTDWRHVSARRANLPGVRAPKPLQQMPVQAVPLSIGPPVGHSKPPLQTALVLASSRPSVTRPPASRVAQGSMQQLDKSFREWVLSTNPPDTYPGSQLIIDNLSAANGKSARKTKNKAQRRKGAKVGK